MSKKTDLESVPVRVILAKGKSSLVEFIDSNGLLDRKYIPTAKIDGMAAPADVLQKGIPYGLPWDETMLEFDPRQFLIEMHNAELWTAEDVKRNPKKVMGVFMKIMNNNLKAVLENANLESKRSQ